MIDAASLKAHRTASSLRVEKGGPRAQKGRLIGRTKGGLSTKLHAVADAEGGPIRFFLAAGQGSDCIGALALLGADWLLADKGYDANWLREALPDRGIKPCSPGRKSRGTAARHDKRRTKRRHRIETMVGCPKDRRRAAMRHDRCPKGFLSAIAHAATAMF